MSDMLTGSMSGLSGPSGYTNSPLEGSREKREINTGMLMSTLWQGVGSGVKHQLLAIANLSKMVFRCWQSHFQTIGNFNLVFKIHLDTNGRNF